jgi:hypothetical protein
LIFGVRYRGRRKTKQKHNTICLGHHHRQTNTYKTLIFPIRFHRLFSSLHYEWFNIIRYLPEHLSSSIVCSVLQVIVCLFVFCLDIVSPSSIYGFLLPFGYLQNITIHMLQVDKIILSDTKGQCSNPKKSRNRIDFSKHSCIPHLLRYQQEDI